jgi:phage gp16-like protein
MISNAKKAVIHIAKAQVGMTDQEYRALLGSVDVESSVDLTNKSFNQVMRQFKKLGFKTTSKTRLKRKTSGLPKSKKALMKKLEAIILDMNLTWAYVDSIAKKRFQVDRAQWLKPPELHKLVIMMQYHSNRKKKKREA